MTLRRLLLALLAALALAVGACSGDDSGDGQTEQTTAGDGSDDGSGEGSDDGSDDGEAGDGCEVVTAADAEELLGEPVEASPDSGTPVPGNAVDSQCVWGATSERSFGLVQYRLWNGAQYFQPDTFKDGEGFEEVDDLGDGAYFTTLTGIDLTVLVGDQTMTLNVSGAGEGVGDDSQADTGAIREKLLTLARRVVEEIG